MCLKKNLVIKVFLKNLGSSRLHNLILFYIKPLVKEDFFSIDCFGKLH